jgi:hypothetical protein
MTIYFRGPCVVVTDKVFEVRYPYRQRFTIRELRDVYVVRSGPDPTAVGATVIALAASVVVAAMWPLLRSPGAWLVAIAVIAALAMTSGTCWALNPTEWELRATYRGFQVQLFRTRDAQQFGQVKRALQRALEADRLW